MEPLAAWLHRKIISRYDLCLVPDYPGLLNLSGKLSHDLKLPGNVHYMGPLSRFSAHAPPPDNITPGRPSCSLILSGPEPQHSLLLEKVSRALRGVRLYVLSATPVQAEGSTDPDITFIISPDAGTMRDLVSRSTMGIARAGYTSVMELVSMGKGAVLRPTPGQTEQEYLGEYLNGHHGFITVRQSDTDRLGRVVKEWNMTIPAAPPDSAPLFEKAINLLLEKKIE
jgi:hypothetical protein